MRDQPFTIAFLSAEDWVEGHLFCAKKKLLFTLAMWFSTFSAQFLTMVLTVFLQASATRPPLDASRRARTGPRPRSWGRGWRDCMRRKKIIGRGLNVIENPLLKEKIMKNVGFL